MSISVEVFGGDIEKALRLFKKKIMLSGIQHELRRRRFHEKPSVKRKRKKLESIRRNIRLKRSV